MENDFFKERETYMYLGGERWVTNNLDLVLFKHHWLTRGLHKVRYVNFSKYKENKTYTTWTNNDFFKESETYTYLGGGRGGSTTTSIWCCLSTTASLDACIK